MDSIGPSREIASSLSKMEGYRSIIAKTLFEAASPFWSWFRSIPRMNIGIVIRVEIRRKVTNCPIVISPDCKTLPPAETRSPN